MCKDTGRELSEDQKKMLAQIEAEVGASVETCDHGCGTARLAPTEAPGPRAA